MQISKKQKTEIFQRKEILQKAKIQLKKEFVGLDNVIDEILNIVEPWFLFPQGQIRPAIINLFGMTGTGKTSLVQRLSQLISFDDRLFKFDSGDYCANDARLRYEFSSKLKTREKQPIIIMFDEFQLGRTVNEEGKEQDRNGLRAAWDLLDSGKFSLINEDYNISRVFSIIFKLEKSLRDGVEVQNGVVVKNHEIYYKYFPLENDDEIDAPRKNKKVKNPPFFPEKEYYYIEDLDEKRFLSNSITKQIFENLNGEETVLFLNSLIENALKPVEHDFSQSLIFVIGNLDEAYQMADDVNPDEDADMFYKHSLTITLPRIKKALQERFRVEQIARLGNNHIIYPAFSSESYNRLISMELLKIQNRVLSDFKLTINFDKSINDIIYKEGVFPTQGTRPVFTTIQSLIESYICKILTDVIGNDIQTKTIHWKYIDEYFYVSFHDEKKKKLFQKEYKIKLKVDNLRKSTNDEVQAAIAIHESGHVVICSLILKLIPDMVFSKTADLNRGVTRYELPDLMTKEIIEKEIMVSLAGYMAEKIVFGTNNLTAGAEADIRNATSKAINYVKKYGMTGDLISIGVQDMNANDSHYFNYQEYDERIFKLIKKCQEKVEECLKENILLLLKLGEFLSNHSKIERDGIREMVLKYNKSGIFEKDLLTKENYYNFKDKIRSGLISEVRKKENERHAKEHDYLV